MRPKIILAALALGLGMLLPAIYFRLHPVAPEVAPQAVATDNITAAVNAKPAAPTILQRVSHTDRPGDAVADGATAPLGSDEHEQYLNDTRVQLYQLGVNHDPAGLPKVLKELHNPDADVRSTAVTAAMEIGSREAIPALEQEMNWADDLHEKIEIQKAIDFLKLPEFALDDNGALVSHRH